ncbi:MAG: ATP-binding protein [Lacrimispora saccharolytica]
MNEYKIMIVDDEPDISELLEKALKIEGFQKIVKIGTGNEAVAAGIGMFYYLFAIPEPEGLSLADWPNRFTANFSLWMANEEGTLQIEKIGLERLEEYGLWIQVIDESGQEVFSQSKPEIYPERYSVSELLALSTNGYENGYTVFVNSFEESGRTWNYLIGFPYAVGKHVLYYNGETVSRLSPIKGYAELLADGTAGEPQTVREYGSLILKNAEHTEKLINDLKLTWQLDSGTFPFQPQQVRMERYLKELVIDIFNDPAFSDREIAFESDAVDVSAAIDPELFRRAVGNLVINGLVHNPPDTKVTVSVRKDQGNGVCISVRDDGKGISEEEQAKLFTRYYRGTNTKEKPEGSGLGLAIAKQIVSLHGGEIAVKSRVGEGTEFTIRLPGN